MLPAERKAELVRAGHTMAEIAQHLGVSISHVSQVVRGIRRSRTTEKAIADAIGREVADVFPPTRATSAA